MPDFDLTEAQCLDLIQRERVVRIAFGAKDERYLIPLGYLWFEGTFAGMTHAGRKTRMASENPRVAFQLDNSAETGVFGWHSVTGEGDFALLTDGATERLAPLLFERFSDGPAWALAELEARQQRGEAVFYQLKPRSFSGRAFTEKPPGSN